MAIPCWFIDGPCRRVDCSGKFKGSSVHWVCVLAHLVTHLCSHSWQKLASSRAREAIPSHHPVWRRLGSRHRSWLFLSCVPVCHHTRRLWLTTSSYLYTVWMFDLLPKSYYDLESPVVWWHVLAQFLVVDFLTYLSHRIVRGDNFLASHARSIRCWCWLLMFDV